MKILISSLLLSSLLISPIVEKTNLNSSFLHPSEGDNSILIQSDFTGSFTMEITELKNGKPGKEGPVRISYYVKGDEVAIQPENTGNGNTIMIFNVKDKTMTTLIEQKGEKTGVKMKMPDVMLNSVSDNDSDYSITKTDESKEIDGYNCRKYLIDSKDNTGFAWVTEDVDLDFEKMFTFLQGDKQKGSQMQEFSEMEGVPLEMYTKSKNKNEEFTMKMLNLKTGEVDAAIFNTAGYEIMDMQNMMNPGGAK